MNRCQTPTNVGMDPSAGSFARVSNMEYPSEFNPRSVLWKTPPDPPPVVQTIEKGAGRQLDLVVWPFPRYIEIAAVLLPED